LACGTGDEDDCVWDEESFGDEFWGVGGLVCNWVDGSGGFHSLEGWSWEEEGCTCCALRGSERGKSDDVSAKGSIMGLGVYQERGVKVHDNLRNLKLVLAILYVIWVFFSCGARIELISILSNKVFPPVHRLR
jgi:hypothetical protein